ADRSAQKRQTFFRPKPRRPPNPAPPGTLGLPPVVLDISNSFSDHDSWSEGVVSRHARRSIGGFLLGILGFLGLFFLLGRLGALLALGGGLVAGLARQALLLAVALEHHVLLGGAALGEDGIRDLDGLELQDLLEV